jgi:hypothetical protein
LNNWQLECANKLTLLSYIITYLKLTDFYNINNYLQIVGLIYYVKIGSVLA